MSDIQATGGDRLYSSIMTFECPSQIQYLQGSVRLPSPSNSDFSFWWPAHQPQPQK